MDSSTTARAGVVSLLWPTGLSNMGVQEDVMAVPQLQAVVHHVTAGIPGRSNRNQLTLQNQYYHYSTHNTDYQSGNDNNFGVPSGGANGE